MSKEFKEYCGFRYILYQSEYECLSDNSKESIKWLRGSSVKSSRSRYDKQFAYISKLRDNPNKFVIVRYNCMGLFVELLTTSSEIELELKFNNKNVKPHVSSSLTKIIERINKIQENKNFLTLKEFKYIVNKLSNTYYYVKPLESFDNAHIFKMFKNIKNDENTMAYIWVET